MQETKTIPPPPDTPPKRGEPGWEEYLEWLEKYDEVEIEPGFVDHGMRIGFQTLVERGHTTPDGEWISPRWPKPPGWGEPGDPYTAHLRGETVPDSF